MSETRGPVDIDALPVDPMEESRPLSWWGTWLFIVTESMIFAALLSSYFFLRSSAVQWPLGDIKPPELLLAGIGTALLLLSSGTAHWGEKGIRSGDVNRLRWGLSLSILLGAGLLGIQGYEYAHSTFTPQTNAYGSIFFGVTGFHGFHLFVGVVILGALLAASQRSGRYTSAGHLPVRLGIIYWHFVDAIWIAVFTSLYLSEHLG